MNVKEAKKMIKKLRISNGTMILLRFDDPHSEDARLTVNNVAMAIDESTLHDIFIIAVEDLESIRAFDVKEMNRMGWFRKSQVSNLFSVISADIKKGNEDVSE